MPAAKPKVVIVSGAQTGPQPEPQADVLGELSGVEGGVVVVHRVPAPEDRDQTQERIGAWPASQFATLEALQDFLASNYGGGKFQIRGRNAKGQWIGSAMTVRLAQRQGPAAAQLGAPVPAIDATEKAVRVFTAVGPIVAPIISAIIARPAPAAPQGLTLADALALAKATQPPSAMDQIKVFAELKQALGGDGDAVPAAAPGNWMDLITTAIRTVGAVLQPPRAAPVEQPQQAESAAAPAALAAPDPAPAPAAPADETAVMFGIVLDAAKRGLDPNAYAVLIADRIGDEAVLQLLDQPDPVAVVVTMLPAAAEHRDWFVKLVDVLRGMYAEEEEPEGQPAKS